MLSACRTHWPYSICECTHALGSQKRTPRLPGPSRAQLSRSALSSAWKSQICRGQTSGLARSENNSEEVGNPRSGGLQRCLFKCRAAKAPPEYSVWRCKASWTGAGLPRWPWPCPPPAAAVATARSLRCCGHWCQRELRRLFCTDSLADPSLARCVAGKLWTPGCGRPGRPGDAQRVRPATQQQNDPAWQQQQQPGEPGGEPAGQRQRRVGAASLRRHAAAAAAAGLPLPRWLAGAL